MKPKGYKVNLPEGSRPHLAKVPASAVRREGLGTENQAGVRPPALAWLSLTAPRT